MTRKKTRIESLQAEYLRKTDIAEALAIPKPEAAEIFREAKQDEHRRKLVEVSPRKVSRQTVEKVTGKKFCHIIDAIQKAATN